MKSSVILIGVMLSLGQVLARPAVEVELPAADGYCFSLEEDGVALWRTDLKGHNAKKEGRQVTREKIQRAIIGSASSALLNRPDIAAAAETGVFFFGEPAIEGGIVCNCAELQCADPTVCGIACKGFCVDCFVCKNVDGPGAPVKGRPRK